MSDRHDDANRTSPAIEGGEPASSDSRRVVLRGAAAAIPTILTLHSGAALARTSNLVSVADGTPVDGHGRSLCVDEQSVQVYRGYRKTYDLGTHGDARVTAIPTKRTYYRTSSTDGVRVTPREMCEAGGDYYYNERNALQTLYEEPAPASAGTAGKHGSSSSSYSGPAAPPDKGWKKVRVSRGGLASATALKSFAGRIKIREI